MGVNGCFDFFIKEKIEGILFSMSIEDETNKTIESSEWLKTFENICRGIEFVQQSALEKSDIIIFCVYNGI